jgi:hypothetical protein
MHCTHQPQPAALLCLFACPAAAAHVFHDGCGIANANAACLATSISMHVCVRVSSKNKTLPLNLCSHDG